MSLLWRLICDDGGQTVVEGALVLAILSMLMLSGFYLVGSTANSQLNSTQSGLTNIGENPPQ